MRAGELNQRVTLQERDPNAEVDAYSDRDPNAWISKLANEPARVYALGGREFRAVQADQSEMTHRVVIRAPTRIVVRQKHRFVWVQRLIGGTRITHLLDIVHVIPLQSDPLYIECMCVEMIPRSPVASDDNA